MSEAANILAPLRDGATRAAARDRARRREQPKRRARFRKRVRRWWRRWDWTVVGGLFLTALILGYMGFRAYFADSDIDATRGDAFYHAVALFFLEGGAVEPDPVPWQLAIARLLAPLVTVLAAIGAILAIFSEQLQAVKLWRMNGHAVVCGLGARGTLLAEAFTDRCDVAAIERDPETDGIEECRDEGVAIVVGDADDRVLLGRTGLRRARYLIAVGSGDGSNAEVAAEARALLAEPRGWLASLAARLRSGGDELEAFVHVVDIRLCSLLRERERTSHKADAVRIRFFNTFETGARAWLEEHPPFPTAEDGEPPARPPHLVVVGVGQMGRSLTVGAVRSWLSLHPDAGERPRITLIDREAHKRRTSLRLRHPTLERFCRLEARELDISSAQFEQAQFLFDSEGRPDVTTIYVCVDNDSLALEAALALHQRLRGHDARIVVRMKEFAGLASLLSQENSGSPEDEEFENLHVFRLLERTCTPEFLLGETTGEKLAKAIHDAYTRRREEDEKKKHDDPVEQQQALAALRRDPAMASWVELPEDLQGSNRRQAEHDRVKLAAIGCYAAEAGTGDDEVASFTREEIDLMATMEHDRWIAERRFEGYTDGPRDHDAKTTPYLVPWAELPPDIQTYDVNTVEAMPTRLHEAGLAIYRRAGDRPKVPSNA